MLAYARIPERSALLLLVNLSALGLGLGRPEERVIQAIQGRLEATGKLYVEFQWYQCWAPRKSDPFDSRGWLHADEPEGTVYNLDCRLWLVRPDLKFHLRGPLTWNRDITQSWVDGLRTSKSLQDGGAWSVVIDEERWNLFGPVPFLTLVEVEIFDIRQSLLELLQAGHVHVETESADAVRLSGKLPHEGGALPWVVRASLDPSRGCLPTELEAEAAIPNRRGTIRWHMKAIRSVPVNDTHAPAEAIIALGAPQEPDRYLIYHYRAITVEGRPGLSKSDLTFQIPERNVTIVDEVNLYTRSISAEGKVYNEEKWTREQRDRDLALIRQSFTDSLGAKAILASRQRMFSLMVIGCGVTVVALVGAWVWRRQRLRYT